MKSKKIAVLLLTLFLTMALSPMSVFAATNVTTSSTASIIIENAVENDELVAYKIINITYDTNNNTLTYAWNSDFEDYFEQKNNVKNSVNKAYTIEQFAAMENDSADLKNLLAGLPDYINTNVSITPVGTPQTVAADGKAIFSDLAMGEYFIRPTNTTSVYQLMLQKVEPTVDSTTKAYVIDDVTFNAKHKEATIVKTADKTSVTRNEKVNYTITVDIPTYGAEATDKSFYVSDLLPDGLTLDTASISAAINGTTVTADTYTLYTTATTDYTFKFSVSTEQYTNSWSGNAGHKLVIKYSATLNNDDTTEVNVKEINTATFDYSNYPYVANSHGNKQDKAEVNTFAIKIDKYVKGKESEKLANAKFDLYRTATQAEIDANKSVTIPHTNIKGILLESGLTTGADGVATFEKYEANGGNYDYYLVETRAPSGYNVLDNAVQVNFTDTDVETTAGVYTVKIPNNSGLTLPITGEEGIVFFSVIGIVLMGGAVLLFVLSRKKKSKENCKK